MSVIARSSVKGRAAEAREPVTVSARCSATGFRLLRLKHDGRDIVVNIHAEDLSYAGEDNFVVSASEMAKYAADIYGEGTSLLTFLNQSYTFRFAEENYRTVPVKAVVSASYKPQYMPSGPVALHPDSVTVYGPDDKLATVDAVLTKAINLGEISKSASGVVKLIPAPGLRMSDSEVAWSLDVSRYVELRSTVPVNVRNVPAGVAFSVLPSSADVIFRCQFPLRSNPAETCEFYVDYEEFNSSLSGRCVMHCDNLPPYVIGWKSEPEVFDCLVREDKL